MDDKLVMDVKESLEKILKSDNLDEIRNLANQLNKTIDKTIGSCPRCGHINDAGSKFCSSCGQELSGEADNTDLLIEESFIVAKPTRVQGYITMSIHSSPEEAINGLRKQLNMGVNCEVYKRTVEKFPVRFG